LLAVITLAAADVNGKWKGAALRSDGSTHSNVYFEFKAEGSTVSGVAGETDVDTVPISNGKLDGDKLTFDIVTPDTSYKITLTAEGEAMKGSAARTTDGQSFAPITLEIKRVKQ
jgi:hypothetical protein